MFPGPVISLAHVKSYKNSLQVWTFLHRYDQKHLPSGVPQAQRQPQRSRRLLLWGAWVSGGICWLEQTTEGNAFRYTAPVFPRWAALKGPVNFAKHASGVVVYSKKYIVGLHPHFQHRAPNPLGISCDEIHKDVLCSVNGDFLNTT